jgi:dymeclin
MYEAIEEHRPLKVLYLLLDILIIVSQDKIYAKNTQIINISSPAWYSERSLRHLTLGGLLMLIILRLISLNLTKLQDAHIHFTTCGILTNISLSVYQMETIVAQRLTSLLDTISKRIQKHLEDNDDSIIMTVYSDALATLLELINTIITHSLKDNPQLTYTLLPRRHLFSLYKDYVRFQPLVDNIDAAIEFFGNKIGENDVTVDSILKVIDEAGYSWGSSRIKV